MKIIAIILIILIVLCLLYLFLVSPRLFHKPDCSSLFGVYYAHRGLFDNTSNAPENSLPAFIKAVENGYGIELDVALTKDDVPVVFHDGSLLRMCGTEGNIWEYTFEELQQFTLADSDCKIPLFSEVLKVINGRVPLIIEYKMDRPLTQVCQLGNELLENYHGPYCIESFHPLAVRWYKKHRPDVIRGQLSEDYGHDKSYKKNPFSFILTDLLTNFFTRPDFIAYDCNSYRNLSRRFCRKLGAIAVAWTVKSREQFEEIKEEFDLFIFDSFILK